MGSGIFTADQLDSTVFREEIKRILNNFNGREKKYVPLYRFIPIIEPRRCFVELVKDIGFPMVIVPFYELVKYGLVRDIVSEGVNRLFGFNGEVLPSSIMPKETVTT